MLAMLPTIRRFPTKVLDSARIGPAIGWLPAGSNYIVAGTLDTRLDINTVTPNSHLGSWIFIPEEHTAAMVLSKITDVARTWLSINRPENSTSDCQSIDPSILLEDMWRLDSSQPPAAKAKTSHGNHVRRRKRETSARNTKAPLPICQVLSGDDAIVDGATPNIIPFI